MISMISMVCVICMISMISMVSMISMILFVFSWFPFVGAYLWSFSGHFYFRLSYKEANKSLCCSEFQTNSIQSVFCLNYFGSQCSFQFEIFFLLLFSLLFLVREKNSYSLKEIGRQSQFLGLH